MRRTYRKLAGEKLNNALYWCVVVVCATVTAMSPNLVQNGVTDWITYTYYLDARWMMPFIILIFSSVLVALSVVFNNIAVPAALLMVFSAGVGVAHTNKLVYRASPILPSDIFLVKDALLATNEYPVVISKSFWLFVALAVLVLVMAFPVRPPLGSGKKGIRRVGFAAVVVLLCAAISVGTVAGVFFNTELLTEKMRYREYPKEIPREYVVNTFYPSFLKIWGESKVEPPEDYDKDTMDELGAGIASLSAETSSGKDADIIILQLESYYIPEKFDFQYDVEAVFGEFFEIMQKGASGYTVPALGGNCTADVEFEVLTGFATNDGQIGANPFSTYVFSGFPGITGYLKEQGYSTAAIHSHSNLLYNRESVYANFGFDNSYFSDDFEDPALHGGYYIKESECIDKLIEVYESMPEEEGRFIHTVSMQNHLPIRYDTYTDDETLEIETSSLDERQTRIARSFITSTAEITKEVARLVEYFESVDRDVILICYGDHQSIINCTVDGESFAVPAMGDEVLGDTPEEQYIATRETPFFVWTNYESGIEGKDLGYLAPNSLLVAALCEANIVRPAYFQYLYDSTEVVKSVSGTTVILNDNTASFDITQKVLDELKIRRLIQHDIVYGKKFLLGSMY